MNCKDCNICVNNQDHSPSLSYYIRVVALILSFNKTENQGKSVCSKSCDINIQFIFVILYSLINEIRSHRSMHTVFMTGMIMKVIY